MTHTMIYVLSIIDFAALLVGLTVLKRVTKIVHEVADTIQREVTLQIAAAEKSTVQGFVEAAAPAIQMLAATMPRVVHDAVESVAGRLTIQGDGKLEVRPSESVEEEHGLRAV